MSVDADPSQSALLRVRIVQVLTAHQFLIQGYALGITRDHHLAEDVFQEVAAIVAQRPEALPAGDGAVPWLREVARRKALELLRRRQRTPLLSDEVLELLGPAFEAEDAAADERGELCAAMAACVDKLPRDARKVVEGRYQEGTSCEQLARRLGRSVQAVYALLKRSRLALADCVERSLGRDLGGSRA